MPLRYYAPGIPPGDIPGGTDPGTVEPNRPLPQASKFIWTSAAGRVTDLANFDAASGVCVAPGAIGLGMPDITYFDTESPTFDGSSVRGWRSPARQIDLPIQLWGINRIDLLNRWRQLVADMKPSRLGPGTLKLSRFDGESRSIDAYYADGLKGEDDDEAWGLFWIRAVITLKCPNPFWYGETVTATFASTGNGGDDPGGGDPSTGLFFPILPLAVSGGLPVDGDPGGDDPLNSVGTIHVDNAGDVNAFPVFTLTGPCDSLSLTNAETGDYFLVNGGVQAGKVLVIDTRENQRSVLEHDVTTPNTKVNRYSSLSAGSSLYTLVEGVNSLDVAAPGISADTNLAITYQTRYHTGY